MASESDVYKLYARFDEEHTARLSLDQCLRLAEAAVTGAAVCHRAAGDSTSARPAEEASRRESMESSGLSASRTMLAGPLS